MDQPWDSALDFGTSSCQVQLKDSPADVELDSEASLLQYQSSTSLINLSNVEGKRGIHF